VGERTQQPIVQHERAQPDERVPAAVALNLDRFNALLEALPRLAPEDREKSAGEIIDLLIAMRETGHDAVECAVVLEQLDLEALGRVVDPEGRNARKEAVETLMAMGFPHALKISPDDFAFARTFVIDTEHPWRRRIRRGLLVSAWLGIASALLSPFIFDARLSFIGTAGGMSVFAAVLAFAVAAHLFNFPLLRSDGLW
jgi:hypothetical protein